MPLLKMCRSRLLTKREHLSKMFGGSARVFLKEMKYLNYIHFSYIIPSWLLFMQVLSNGR